MPGQAKQGNDKKADPEVVSQSSTISVDDEEVRARKPKAYFKRRKMVRPPTIQKVSDGSKGCCFKMRRGMASVFPSEVFGSDVRKSRELSRLKEEDKRGPKVFHERYASTFAPIRTYMTILGNFPFGKSKIDSNDVFRPTLEWSMTSPKSLYLIFLTILFTLTLTISFINYSLFLFGQSLGDIAPWVGSPHGVDERVYERAILRRNFPFIIWIYLILVSNLFVCYHLLINGRKLQNYFSFWSKIVKETEMDVSRGSRRASYILLFLHVIFVLLFLMAGIAYWPATGVGLPLSVSILLFREIDKDFLLGNDSTPDETHFKHGSLTLSILQGFSLALILLIYLFSKPLPLLFIFHCRMLQNMMRQFNERVYHSIILADNERPNTLRRVIFSDHSRILDLIDLTDFYFANCLEVYYLANMTSIIFLIYHLVVTASMQASQRDSLGLLLVKGLHERPYDWILSFILLIIEFTYLVCIVFESHAIYQEGMKGFELVRRKSTLGKRNDDELHFMISMIHSYNFQKRMWITCKGYFAFNKPFLVFVLSIIISFAAVIIQLGPFLDYKDLSPEITKKVKCFIKRIEWGEGC